MTLLDLQRTFYAEMVRADEPASARWPADRFPGATVYRHAYRSRLIECLRGSFDKTLAWIGDDSFAAAAAHHLITRPPQSWTLDDAGTGFAETVAGLFPDDAEVGELAWLEWQMQTLFVATDYPAIDATAFADHSATFSDDDWTSLRLSFTPNIAARWMSSDCAAIWHAIDREEAMPDQVVLDAPALLLVWRDGLSSRFRTLEAAESQAYAVAKGGVGFGELCELMVERLGPGEGVASAGRFMGQWIAEGMVVTAVPVPTPA